MIRTLTICTLQLLFLTFVSKANDNIENRSLNNFGINAFGNASLVSVGYERILISCSKFLLAGKVGVGYNYQKDRCWMGGCPDLPKTRYLTIPHHLTGNFGRRIHFFEFGLGGTSFIGDNDEIYQEKQKYLIYPIIGYRLQPLETKRLFLRFFVYFPVPEAEVRFTPIGINLGLTF